MLARRAPAMCGLFPQATFPRRQISAGVFQKLDKDQLPNIVNMWDVIEERGFKVSDPDNQYACELQVSGHERVWV